MHYNTAAVVVEGMEEDYKMAAAIDTLMNDSSPSKPKQTRERDIRQTKLYSTCFNVSCLYIAKYINIVEFYFN